MIVVVGEEVLVTFVIVVEKIVGVGVVGGVVCGLGVWV